MLLVMAIAADPAASRSMQVSVLLFPPVRDFCNLLIPSRLANRFLSGEREQRTLLVGPVGKARIFSEWLGDAEVFGFGIRGSVADDESQESRLLHVSRVSDASMLQRIISNEAIRQIVLPQLPLDQEGLSCLVDFSDSSSLILRRSA
jgi:hypothetical protein